MGLKKCTLLHLTVTYNEAIELIRPILMDTLESKCRRLYTRPSVSWIAQHETQAMQAYHELDTAWPKKQQIRTEKRW